ncbi:helix-turn-helix domain-containing protein [Bacillus sp. 3H-10]|uniref:Helix-turn-helix domain-containing protein n=1 Tax=Bacillus aquiflavi TaxID=2672567 RepID=A0A6B3W2H3_9BACI|nr:helix-turn-helix domain-containing protein [Bacillus aquiflavi]UAC47793.1 helix-turn-helix domain-containing protein [Bacillus aquiflavi]
MKIFFNQLQPLTEGFRPCKRCRPDLQNYLTTKEQLIEKAIKVMSHTYSKEINLSELARELYVSPFYLQKIFKNKLGISPAQYLKIKRIESAKELMINSRLSMTEIALEVGFKNSAHFSSVFRKIVGVSPTAFRSALQGD